MFHSTQVAVLDPNLRALARKRDPSAAEVAYLLRTAGQPGAVRAVLTQARRRMFRNVRGMQKNEDMPVDTLAGAMLERGRYPWDVL